MKVKDVLHTEVDYVYPNATVLEAARLIFGRHHLGLPVVDPLNKRLIGFVTDQDILYQLFPTSRELFEDYVHERKFEQMENKIKYILEKKVGEIMNTHIYSVTMDEPLLKAESLMKVHDISRLPVVDEDRHLVGILSKGDIFRLLVSRKLRGFV
ncbi:MAG: HPP family protein [Candidatus Levyibacteriota bacterium]